MEPQVGSGIQVGSIVEGRVTGITKFGAFVTLEGGRSGLVHISEIANTFVNEVRDYLQEGQTVRVLVLSMDNGKLNLSIKRAQPRPANRPPRQEGASPSSRPGAPRSAPPRSAASHAGASGRPAPSAAPRGGETLPPSGDRDFEDKLKKFLSSSEGKMADLNRSMDGRRGGGRRRR